MQPYLPNWTFSVCFWLLVSLFCNQSDVHIGTHIFLWPLQHRELKATLNCCHGTSLCLGFAEPRGHSLQKKYKLRFLRSTQEMPSHKYQLYSAMLCPSDRKRHENIVFNRRNCVTKLSIHLAFDSKKELFLNSSCHCGETWPRWEKSGIYFPVQPTQQHLFHLEIFWVCINPKAHMHKLKLKNKEQEGLED